MAPALRGGKTLLDADLAETLLALAMAARWGRAVEPLAPYTGTGAADSLGKYLANVLRPWKTRQLARLQTLGGADALLVRSGYARALAATARALAVHRLYAVVRSSPIAAALKRDYVRRTRYYGALGGELLDIRQRSAVEDAAVAELLFEQGVHRAPDADEWFSLQRADLRNLRIEPSPPIEPSSDDERIVHRLPSAYVPGIFGESALDDPRLLRLMIEHGLTPQQRRVLVSRKLTPESNENLAYFQAALALRMRRFGAFDEVVARLASAEQRSAATELLLATARSLRTGQQLLAAGTHEEQGWLFDVTPLLALADTGGPERERAFALNNAAWLSIAANSPASLGVASELSSRARALAPGEPCLRPLVGPWFVAEPARPSCSLPLEP